MKEPNPAPAMEKQVFTKPEVVRTEKLFDRPNQEMTTNGCGSFF